MQMHTCQTVSPPWYHCICFNLPPCPTWTPLCSSADGDVSLLLLVQLRIPRVVGMLGTGLLLANVPGGVVAAFPKRWGVQMRAAALGTIFLRCGLELEFKVGCDVLNPWPPTLGPA